MKSLAVILLLACLNFSGFSQTGITAEEASMRIGDSLTVKDKVYSGKLLSNGMTLLNLGGNYPKHYLVVMIKSEDRSKFTYAPEEELKGKWILVTGRLIDYKGKAEIIVSSPSQIKITIPPEPDDK